MDIYAYLKMDHHKVAHLFQLFERSKIAHRRPQIVDLILLELEIHTKIEEETFYKTLALYVNTKADAIKCRKEHQEIKTQIETIKTMSPGKAWETALLELKESVEQHVKEEEEQVFPHAQLIISEHEALILKQKAHELREQLLGRRSKTKEQIPPIKPHMTTTQPRQSGHTSL